MSYRCQLCCRDHTRTTNPTPQTVHDRTFDEDSDSEAHCGYWTAACCRECGALEPESILIAVSGAYRDYESLGPLSAVGVYFGLDNHLNEATYVRDHHPSHQKAELWAAILAIMTAMQIKAGGAAAHDAIEPICWQEDEHICPAAPTTGLRRIVIKANSRYLVQGITKNIYTWKTNSWKRSQERPLINSALFCLLDTLITTLNNEGVRVQFWDVSKKNNHMARRLAKGGLGGLTAEQVIFQFLISKFQRAIERVLGRKVAVQTDQMGTEEGTNPSSESGHPAMKSGGSVVQRAMNSTYGMTFQEAMEKMPAFRQHIYEYCRSLDAEHI